MTAYPSTTLLIAGGAGAVGHYAVQFAKAAGAKSSPPSARRKRPRPRARPAPMRPPKLLIVQCRLFSTTR